MLSIRLTPAPDRSAWVEELVAATGHQVGLTGVLGNLGRRGAHVNVPAWAAAYGFSWDRADGQDEEWWPQGVTTSADAADTDRFRGRHLVLVSWYARPRGALPSRGTRVSVVDITTMTAPRYEHVLLVEPSRDDQTGALTWTPVTVHAGGICWHGRTLFVADTGRGLRSFALDRLTRLDEPIFGMRHVLPQHGGYQQQPVDGQEPFRFSFVSVDRSRADHRLLVGEYSATGTTARLAELALDPDTSELRLDGGFATATVLPDGVGHMQGAVVVDGTTYATVSRGSRRRGTVMARSRDGRWHAHTAMASVGPEDLSYWPQRDQLWSLGEHPRQRYVYAMPRHRFRQTRRRLPWIR